MPMYTFEDRITGDQVMLTMTISERDEYEAANPDMFQVIGASPLIDPMKLGLVKPDSAFRDVLKEVQKAHPLSQGINTW